jgi:hypothetical protein
LRHHQRRGLRMRWRASELHRCEGCRGKQHEAKFCHDDLSPGGNLGSEWGVLPIVSAQGSTASH